MSTTRAHRPPTVPSTESAIELSAAIEDLPRFVQAPIFMPTERMPVAAALAGLERVKALYDDELDAIHRPRLRALKQARRARRCFIIGNGPSLAKTDLSRLSSEATFATNGFFLKMPELEWLPTYYVVEDHLVGEDRAEELSALSGTIKLFPASLAYALRPDEETIYFDHRPRKSFPDGFDFSFEADVNTWTGGTVTFTCMQLAAYLGYQEIYLIGVDADYAIPADAALSGDGRIKSIDMPSDDPNHFHPDYFGKGKRWHEPNVDVMLGAYEEARRATEARGVSIVNATVGGKLEVFPRIDYESLFRAAPAERLLLLDHTLIGNATATGEVKSAILGSWPADLLMQVHDTAKGRLRIAGGPQEADNAGDVATPVEDFDADLIFYRPVPRTDVLHDFAMDLIARSHLPLALWIVDDWPTAYALEDPEAAAALDADFRWLVERADVRFSISASMSAAFHKRYGQPFIPIANGIVPSDWEPARLRQPGPIRVRYAGGLAENMTLATVGAVARVVEGLAESGLDISLEIKTHGHWRKPSVEWMLQLQHTSVSSSDLAMADYRAWLAGADILLIAYNFDGRSRDYIRYSLANKLPECLASGAAVLAVGPSDVGTIATMAALDVGERITVPDEAQLTQAIRGLAESPERRLELAQRAQEVAFSLFDVGDVRRAFDASVSRVAAAHRTGEYPRDLHAHVDETAVVADLLQGRRGASHVMLDVGAHGGSSALKFVSKGWTVHSFEPQPAMREALVARFEKKKSFHVDPRAIGDATAKGVPLYESPLSSGITSLRPFHPSHRATINVDVTTIAEVARELGLSRVDFLKIDVEGLDLAVLRGVPWGDLLPDVIECEFEDAKTLDQGHSWRDMAAFLRDRGYAVYVSEWHPVVQYGTRHDWRRVAPFSDELDVHPDAWGNFVAFREDPGWPAVRRAFDRSVERGTSSTPKRPKRASRKAEDESPNGRPDVAALAGSNGAKAVTAAAAAATGTLEVARPAPTAAPRSEHVSAEALAPAPAVPAAESPGAKERRRATETAANRRKGNAPGLRRMLKLSWRVVRHLVRRGRWTAVGLAVLTAWVLLGFVPALAPVSWLIWELAVLGTVAFAGLYAVAHLLGSMRTMSRDIGRLRRARDIHRKRLAAAKLRTRRLEGALAKSTLRNADLSRDLVRVQASIEKRLDAALERQAEDGKRADGQFEDGQGTEGRRESEPAGEDATTGRAG